MRELNSAEMVAVIKAAKDALPDGAKDNNIIVLVVARNLPNGDWINRVSDIEKSIANSFIIKWVKSIFTREQFGNWPEN